MQGIVKSQRMLVESEAQYMAIRGGMSDDERDVASPPASPGLSRHIAFLAATCSQRDLVEVFESPGLVLTDPVCFLMNLPKFGILISDMEPMLYHLYTFLYILYHLH